MSEPLIDPASTPASWAHRFTLGDWNTRASVRVSEHTYQLPPDLKRQLETRHWFAPEFLPYLNHPAIKAAGRAVAHRLSANHLVYFLDYTTLLEHRIVNRSVETIVHNELGVSIPPRMKTAALQLYTDEAYHALFSNSLAEQIADIYGMTERPVLPQRIARLNALLDRTPDKHKALAWILVGFVSETIIAKELLDVCRDTLVSSVQEMLRDHLADEARHSRYFCEVFHYLWLQLSCGQRTFTARSLLEILLLFFEVDERWLGESLRSAGLSEASVAQILGDLTGEQAQRLRARSGAGATLNAMKKAGFFDLPANRQLFSRAGLLDE
ncbi:aminobenzoate oxygenase [Pseudomonas mandelii]|uniref:diiron oxygenase n=1 Tax=Pseudomonas TaxID=286 RepID=UPI000B96A3D6|nr:MULTISPECIES: diiron oxygenase [Pseudomonas]OYQ15203.1 aminobenzoate oxygenase [Pseudomonas mandelii]